jgi:hypothetical protein
VTPFTAEELQTHLRVVRGLRVGDETAKYIVSQLAHRKSGRSFPVFATDARTGQPLYSRISPADLDPARPTLF